MEEVRNGAQRTESDLEVERRRVQGLQNIKEQSIVMQLEIREYKQEREKLHQSIQDMSSECERLNLKMQEEYQRIT